MKYFFLPIKWSFIPKKNNKFTIRKKNLKIEIFNICLSKKEYINIIIQHPTKMDSYEGKLKICIQPK